MKPRHKRASIIAGGLAAVGLAAYFVLNAFESNLVFFFTPTQIAAGEAPKNRTFRVGGMVKDGSVKRDNLTVAFVVTDTSKEVPVSYTGILPDLFREGKGVVAQDQPDGSEIGLRVRIGCEFIRDAGRFARRLIVAMGVALIVTLGAWAPLAAQQDDDDQDVSLRLHRAEEQVRQLTGMVEQLQFRNRQLEQQLQQARGASPAAPSAAGQAPSGQVTQGQVTQLAERRTGANELTQPNQNQTFGNRTPAATATATATACVFEWLMLTDQCESPLS